MTVELVTSYSQEIHQAINKLIPQLSSSSHPLNAEEIHSLLSQPGMYLFVYRDEDATITGMLSLATFTIPTGTRAWIEDVVVTSVARGQGVGQQLVEAGVQKALKCGAKSVDLTSRPSREAANRLYRRCGFGLRTTNVYRYQENQNKAS